jgi:hypothetical protein
MNVSLKIIRLSDNEDFKYNPELYDGEDGSTITDLEFIFRIQDYVSSFRISSYWCEKEHWVNILNGDTKILLNHWDGITCITRKNNRVIFEFADYGGNHDGDIKINVKFSDCENIFQELKESFE